MFPEATSEFLADLRSNNTREWFDANRARYERDVLEPAKSFVRAAAGPLDRLAPGIAAEPRVLGSIFRINRDTRFSTDKRPYKDHLDFWFWHGPRASAVSGLFLRLSPDGVATGAGAHSLEKEALRRYRAAVCDRSAGSELAGIARGLDEADIDLFGRSLTRPPAGHVAPADAGPLLLHRALFAAVEEPPQLATRPDLLERVEVHWTRLAPLHLWLVRYVQEG
jgi:uncharacterized protein (TIGR02453 family)